MGRPILKRSKYYDGNLKLIENRDLLSQYIQKLLSFVEVSAIKPLKVVVNAGNGSAGIIIDELEKHLPIHFIKINHKPDGNFPNGIPNPLLFENRTETSRLVQETNADLGIAWDGDFDRCFLFDEYGNFIEGYYLVGLLAKAYLSRYPGSKIIHDPRLTWNTVELVREYSGIPIQSKTGHAFIKERMRLENAVYGGEMSAHHYFREFAYCDSGMIPWLLIIEIMCKENKPLSGLIGDRTQKFPCSGEINIRIENPTELIDKIMQYYSSTSSKVDQIDGLSMEFRDWRFNLRMSNTEPLIRLNVETKENSELLKEKTNEILHLVRSLHQTFD